MNARGTLCNGPVDGNAGVVQLLGLCPLLAVSTTLANGLGLGLATLAVLLATNLVAAAVGRRLPDEVRIGVFVVVIAALVTTVELAMAARAPGMHAALGIFLPLIVSNCLVLSRAESFAARAGFADAALDGVAVGMGFLLVLAGLGAIRELLGHGTLGADLSLLAGATAGNPGVRFFDARHDLLVVLLPPGAFILVGLLLAARNWLRDRARTMDEPATAPAIDAAP